MQCARLPNRRRTISRCVIFPGSHRRGVALPQPGGAGGQPQPPGLPHLPLLSSPRGTELHPAAHLPVAPRADRPGGAPGVALHWVDPVQRVAAGLGAGSVSPPADPWPPLTPREGWLSDGRQVLRFRPTRWQRTYQRLKITTGEVLPDQEILLLKSRRELSRIQAVKLWREKLQEG